MRGAVARGGRITVEHLDDPVPGTGQVLVEPLACGICGSDLHLLEMQEAMPEILPGLVLGHEFVGRILEMGPGGEGRLKTGAVVTSVPYLDTDAGPQLIGLSPVATGGLAERMVLQEHRLRAVPAGVPPERAAVAEPLAVGAHAVGAARMDKGDVALVVGCGPVGLAVIASLKAAGLGPVVAADFSPGRRRLAETTGADVVVDPAGSSPYAAWSDLAGPALPPSPLLDGPARANTVIFECVGVPGLLNTVMESAPAHTRVVVVGVCNQPDTISPVTGITKELSLQFVFAYRPDEFDSALRWIVDGVVDVGPWITGTCRLDGVAQAFSDLRRPDDHCKILVTP